MMLEELLAELNDPRLSLVEFAAGDQRHGSETAGRYLSVRGHLWPEPSAWAEGGAQREHLEAFVANALEMVAAYDAGMRTIGSVPPSDIDPEQGDKDHQVPADLIELYETLEWHAAVEGEQPAP